MNKKMITAICLIIILTTVLIFSYLDRMALFALSRFYGTDISYKAMTRDPAEEYVFEGIKVMNKRIGFGIYSSRASFKPVKRLDFWKSMDFDLKFKDVHFVKLRGESPKTSYGSPEDIVSMPFEGRWKYRDITGSVEIFSNGITLKKFTANGNQIRLFISGDIFYDSVIDTNITILFSREVLKDIPQELHSVIMNEEPKDWKSFSVNLKGNISSPALQISGRLFRLNVGTVVVRD